MFVLDGGRAGQFGKPISLYMGSCFSNKKQPILLSWTDFQPWNHVWDNAINYHSGHQQETFFCNTCVIHHHSLNWPSTFHHKYLLTSSGRIFTDDTEQRSINQQFPLHPQKREVFLAAYHHYTLSSSKKMLIKTFPKSHIFRRLISFYSNSNSF